MSNTIKSIILGLTGATVLATAANAGGFSRGSADTDLLYDAQNFVMRTGVTYVSPTRKYTANANPALVGTSPTDPYAIYSGAMKLNLIGGVSCVGTVSQPYGGSATYAAPTSTGVLSEQFEINELGATCGYKYDLSKGSVHLIGGVFGEQFGYDRANFTPFGNANLSLTGTDIGYRLGIGYQIPEIALKAQLMYRSGTSFGATGTLSVPNAALAASAASTAAAAALPNAAARQVFAAAAADTANAATIIGGAAISGTITPAEAGQIQAALGSVGAAIAAAGTGSTPLAATGTGTLPQSVELKLQSGVAPGWLVFGSVKWTDWSVLDRLVVNSAAGEVANLYFWKDGWTVTAGVGHQLTDMVSLAGGLTWDRGVGTGFDLSSTTWTGFGGVNLKPNDNAELSFGGALTRITGISETAYTSNASTDGGWAYALSGSLKVKF